MFERYSYTCIKVMVIVFNLLFWLAGCTLFGIGVWLLSNREEVAGAAAMNINYKSAPILCVVIGMITVVVAFFACCGAIKENQCMLGTYFASLLVIFILEITAISLTYVYRKKIERNLRHDIRETLDDYMEADHGAVSKAIDEIQHDFKCCGNYNYKDWFDTSWGKRHPGSVPKSCCKEMEPGCNKNVSEDFSKIYTRGCYYFVKKYLSNNLHVISGFGIWIAVIQLMGMVFALCLCSNIRSGDGTYA